MALAGVSSAPKISLPSTFCFPSSRTNLFPTAAPAAGEIASAFPEPPSFTSASRIAAMILRYPVHRQSTPPIASMTSFSCGTGFLSSKAVAATSIPGVHAPHCAAPWLRNACCTLPPTDVPEDVRTASPSTVVTSHPSTCPVATRHAQTGSPSNSTVQAPQSPASHPTLVPVSPSSSRNTRDSRCHGELETATARPFTRNTIDCPSVAVLGSRVPAISRTPHRSSTPSALAAVMHPSGIRRWPAHRQSARAEPDAPASRLGLARRAPKPPLTQPQAHASAEPLPSTIPLPPAPLRFANRSASAPPQPSKSISPDNAARPASQMSTPHFPPRVARGLPLVTHLPSVASSDCPQ